MSTRERVWSGERYYNGKEIWRTCCKYIFFFFGGGGGGGAIGGGGGGGVDKSLCLSHVC